MLETVFVLSLFTVYIALWRIKQVNLIRQTGIDLQVLEKSQSNVQLYFSVYTEIMTFYGAVAILLLTLNVQFGSLFTRVTQISSLPFDIAGLVIGLAGLSLCLYAQTKMGTSWRVGIDEQSGTSLVTTGLYSYIRNPTYVGLFFFNLGLWVIWPTWAMFLLNLLFIFFLEVQVRSEEDFLSATHGEEYLSYKKRTKRYIPYIY
jgi:protein-S-isoprenylcysteine O-methyltransferase Ste14